MLDFYYTENPLSFLLSSTRWAWCLHIHLASTNTSLPVRYFYFSIVYEACGLDLPGKVWKPPRHGTKGKWQNSPFLQVWKEELWGESAWQAFHPHFNYLNELTEEVPDCCTVFWTVLTGPGGMCPEGSWVRPRKKMIFLSEGQMDQPKSTLYTILIWYLRGSSARRPLPHLQFQPKCISYPEPL